MEHKYTHSAHGTLGLRVYINYANLLEISLRNCTDMYGADVVWLVRSLLSSGTWPHDVCTVKISTLGRVEVMCINHRRDYGPPINYADFRSITDVWRAHVIY